MGIWSDVPLLTTRQTSWPPGRHFLYGVEGVAHPFFAAQFVDDGHEGDEIGEEMRPCLLTENR